MSDHQLLNVAAHREVRVRRERSEALGDAVMTALVVPDEFRQVQASYPILFRQNRERTGFVALALFGFDAGENLFLADERWDAPYLPLSIDIQPFLIGGAPDGGATPRAVVDMASPRIATDGGVRLFDREGRPSPYLDVILERLGALDAGYRASAAFFDALDRYRLLEPFTLEVALDSGATNRLVGFHTIAEERLAELDAATLGKLNADGHLLPIYMAVASLANLPALIARKNKRG
ncbi:SapC family protein [Sphingomonas hankookensis]|uniref:Multidrug transporter n=1 Tax=Sphingomonas hengshuiensis TaxID=1609977 RepID=A0A2W4ZD05_9SPHN|nr:MAG: multidrug transporter [Sphingomonas hengshuiensis]